MVEEVGELDGGYIHSHLGYELWSSRRGVDLMRAGGIEGQVDSCCSQSLLTICDSWEIAHEIKLQSCYRIRKLDGMHGALHRLEMED